MLNRTVRVNADGSWLLPNVPSGTGQVKARATCVENGVTRSGESDFFTIVPNRMNAIPPIHFGSTSSVPTAVKLEPNPAMLALIADTLQLTATASYSGKPDKDVSAASTDWRSVVKRP